jgi:nanoRNase/pAp phosphatase (c-di-AMP/oligoRNAs hydrolase)
LDIGAPDSIGEWNSVVKDISPSHTHEGNPIDQARLNQMRASLGDGPILILAHDSPDPDALSSGKGLAVLFEQAFGLKSHLIYEGLVARAENRAMLRVLASEWVHVEGDIDFEDYSAVVLVDSQPGAGNNSLPPEQQVHVVIDHHHPLRDSLKTVPFVDVRPEIGATSSMVYEYLEAAGIEPDPDLATALFYGLQTDTQGLARNASPEDQKVYMDLLTRIDRQKLIKIEQAGLSKMYFQAFSQGLQAALIYNRAVVAYLGELTRPDFAAEMADVFIRLESADSVLCYGYHEDVMFISLRTGLLGRDAGLLAQRIVASLGKAGGHGNVAGGQINLNDHEIEWLVAEIKRRFLSVMGDGEVTGVPLLSEEQG